MILTKPERWILINQYRILEHLDPANVEEYKMMQEVLERGYEQEYDDKTQYIYEGNYLVTAEKSSLIINVMAMYDALQQSYDQLSDKSSINDRLLLFPGFDGNNEGEYIGYARFLREKDSRFTSLRVVSRDLNSHTRTIDTYNRMHDVWVQLGEPYELSLDGIQSILNARIHPDHR